MKQIFLAIYVLFSINTYAQLSALYNGNNVVTSHSVEQAYRSFNFEVDTFDQIYNLIDEIDTVQILETIQHLQDYGTRVFNTPQAVQAQNWIAEKFQSYGLSVEIQDFPTTNGESSDNVIATLTGKLYPDEFVVIGGHYDSYAFWGSAPGADDNASGTAGVIEAARVLSQYEFDRTIIFCAFGAEEIGLVGSDAYVRLCKLQGMNILGYYNLDMIAYVKPGEEPQTDIIAPATAQSLVDFYMDVAAIYLPDFQVNIGNLTGGDSDHTSFNRYGYMGIFPFEDDQNYSPFIHTPSDVIGQSVNSMKLARNLVAASLASTVSMAVPSSNVGIGQVENLIARIWPNPFSEELRVSIPNEQDFTFELKSVSGQLIQQGSGKSTLEIPTAILKSGLYILQLKSKNGNYLTKVVKH
jgi:acetylornithine deacetylase/succinyl-diaminopimelate desuccinylase-like protein